jgi:hypothetical protein
MLTVFHTSQITIGRTRSYQSVTVFTSRYSVVAPNGGRSLSLGSWTVPGLTLTAHNDPTPLVILLTSDSPTNQHAQSQSYDMTDGQLATHLGQLRVCWYGALSDEVGGRGLVAYNHCWVLQAQSFSYLSSWPCFTVSYLRLPKPGGPGLYTHIPQEQCVPDIPSGTGLTDSSHSYVTTDGHSASHSWCQAFIWDPWSDLYYCQTVVSLLMWGTISEERAHLWFTIAAGFCQYSHSRIRVPRDLWSYFTVSDSRLAH